MNHIDIDKANKFIASIMEEIRNSPSISSNQRQAEVMGLGYGTVRSLLNPSSSVRNLPDWQTLSFCERIPQLQRSKLGMNRT